MKKLNCFILFCILILFTACKNEQNVKNNSSSNELKKNNYSLIVQLAKTDESEVLDDIGYSVNKLSNYLTKNNIKVVINNDAKWSGYILQKDTTKKKYEGAMTDVDLMMCCNEFFSIKEDIIEEKDK